MPAAGSPEQPGNAGGCGKVLGEIDDYDRVFSDESNEIESFANAYMEYKNVQMEDGDIDKGAVKRVYPVFHRSRRGWACGLYHEGTPAARRPNSTWTVWRTIFTGFQRPRISTMNPSGRLPAWR